MTLKLLLSRCCSWPPLGVLPACVLLFVACGDRQSVRGAPESIRWIVEDPRETLDSTELFESTSIAEWQFANTGLRSWSIVGSASSVESTPSREGVLLVADDSRVLLLHRPDIDAKRIDVVEVDVTAPARAPLDIGPMRLAWAAAGQPLSSEREVPARGLDILGSAVRTYRFVLAGHPAWAGRIGRIRLAFEHPPGGIVLQRIALLRERLHPESLSSTLERGVKAALGDEFRNALPGVPGFPVVRELTVPPNAELRLAYGLPETIRQPVRFRATFVDGTGRSTELLESLLDPSTDSDRWHQAVVDLVDYSRESGRLELATIAEGSFEPAEGLPLWGNPRLTTRHRSRLPNVVLISIDTLRADHLSLYGYRRPTSPRLDAWARRSAAVFRSAVAQSTWTLPSHVSMLTGLDTFRHGVNFYGMSAPPSLTFLAEVLRKAGYFTMAATAGGLLDPRYGFLQGFDRYWYYSKSRATGEELSEGLGRSLSWLDETGDVPFFLFFHTYEVHTPWRSRQPYFDRFSELPPVADMRVEIPEPQADDGYLGRIDTSSIEIVRPELEGVLSESEAVALAIDAYDSGIAFTDEQLSRLFGLLAEKGLDSNTIVVVTSDHGELLGEYGVVGHRYLYEENVLVPLIIAAPGRRGAGSVIDRQVRLIDIFPTVLELAGLEIPNEIDGRSLVPLLDDPARPFPDEAWTYSADVNYGVSLRLANRLKYTFNDTAWWPLQGTEALYALDPPADEEHSILSDADDAARLRSLTRARIVTTPGLRLRMRAGEGERIRGHLTGSDVRPNRVKSLDIPCACVRYRPETVEFDVPPDHRYTLILQGVEKEGLMIELVGSREDGDPNAVYRVELDPSDLAAGEHRVLGLGDSGWLEPSGSMRPATSIEIWWSAAELLEGVRADADEALLDRLRALGYIQ